MPLRCANCNVSFDDTHRYCTRCGRLLIETKKPGHIGLIATGFLAFVVVFGFLSWQFSANFKKSLKGRFFAEKGYEVTVPPPTMRVFGTDKPTFSTQDMKALRDLFEKKQFDALTATATDLQAAFERDPAYEYQIYDFFFLYATALPEYQELLDAWVARSPTHFAPYLARAHYYYDKAWGSRGSSYASETTSEQFRGMHAYFQKAARDIDTALVLNPRLMTAYIMRIGMHNAESEKTEKDAAVREARALFPSSFLVYSSILRATLPRWGGSYAAMEALAREAFKQVDKNPEMYMLFGYIYADQAWVFREQKEYDKAIALYSQAISYGEHRSFFEERARTYYYMQKYDLALNDAQHSIVLRPTVAASYRLKATINIYREDLDSARQDIRFLKQQFPGDRQTQEWYAWAAKQILNYGHAAFKADLEQAIAKYDLALDIDPQYAEAFYWRGVAYNKLKKTDRAYADIKQSIKYNSRHIESYQMLDHILASQQKWDEIIDHWDRFLELEPSNAKAYLERAGTYKHKGDMKRARADLQKACGLGEQEACKIQQRYEK